MDEAPPAAVPDPTAAGGPKAQKASTSRRKPGK